VRKRGIVRNDHADEKRAEKGVDSDTVGGERSESETRAGEQGGNSWRQMFLVLFANNPRGRGADDEKHQREKRGDQGDGANDSRRLGLHESSDEGKQAPCGDVADTAAAVRAVIPRRLRSRRKSRRSRASTGNAVTDMATPTNSANSASGRAERAIQPDRQRRPQQERSGNACLRNYERRARLGAKPVEIEFDSHEEHEQDHADLRNCGEIRQNHRRKQVSRNGRGDAAKQRRSERNPGDHFADDGWLANAPESAPRRCATMMMTANAIRRCGIIVRRVPFRARDVL
jgi:hypothetical protein